MKDDIPMLDMNDDDFKEKLDFALWSTDSGSDYRNDRERPYNGQSHTDDGIRGQQIVEGLTMRDIRDCLIQAFLASSCNSELQKKTVEISDEFKGSEYANKGDWRVQDVYKVDLSQIDPLAVCQNLTCFIEHYMGIFPNLKSK